MIEELFFQQIIITMLGVIGAIITVILGWYLKKRETYNRRKEDLQDKLVKKIGDIATSLDNHLVNAQKDVKRIDDRVDNLKQKNNLIE